MFKVSLDSTAVGSVVYFLFLILSSFTHDRTRSFPEKDILNLLPVNYARINSPSGINVSRRELYSFN